MAACASGAWVMSHRRRRQGVAMGRTARRPCRRRILSNRQPAQHDDGQLEPAKHFHSVTFFIQPARRARWHRRQGSHNSSKSWQCAGRPSLCSRPSFSKSRSRWQSGRPITEAKQPLRRCNRLEPGMLDGVCAGFVERIAAVDVAIDLGVAVVAHWDGGHAQVFQQLPACSCAARPGRCRPDACVRATA